MQLILNCMHGCIHRICRALGELNLVQYLVSCKQTILLLLYGRKKSLVILLVLSDTATNMVLTFSDIPVKVFAFIVSCSLAELAVRSAAARRAAFMAAQEILFKSYSCINS